MRSFKTFPIVSFKVDSLGFFFFWGGGVRGTVPSSNLEEMNYEREVGERKRDEFVGTCLELCPKFGK